jgi:hypothetical protein
MINHGRGITPSQHPYIPIHQGHKPKLPAQVYTTHLNMGTQQCAPSRPQKLQTVGEVPLNSSKIPPKTLLKAMQG